MQFKHPEFLYALFLLVIPILIHLFQLRRFQKVEFTNVKFLKSVKLQTRKSSQIKKWLTLLTRMLLLACVIIAFAQPFIPKTSNFNEAQETVLYLDNSFSMQAKGSNGTLLNEAIQDIINTLPEDETISLFTNDKTFRNSTVKALKNELIQLSHSPTQLNYEAVFLKGKQLFSNQGSATRNLVLVSDFQQNESPLNFQADSTLQLNLVQPKSSMLSNISIDSLYVSSSTAETLELNVKLSNQGEPIENVSISLFNNDELVTKSAIDIDEESQTTFTISSTEEINGKLMIDDDGLQYDNVFYFNINSKPNIKVLAINEHADDSYLKRIYTEDEFDYKGFKLNELNFNLIPEQNLIILNELGLITDALRTALLAFKSDGGHILIIPSSQSDLNTYNRLFQDLQLNTYTNQNTNEKRVTSINYEHPLLENAFYSKVTNFQYPKVTTSYQFSSNANAVLSYEDGSPFIIGTANVYVFSSALNSDNSNFKNSQLIVPVLYNMGLQSLKLPQLYYTIGQPNSIAIQTSIGQDDILTLDTEETSVIPLQKTYSKSVVLETNDFPSVAGILNVKNKETVLQNLSFNYNRSESNLKYHDLSSLKNTSVESSLETTINAIKSNTNVNALWKWFVIFALAFLIIEMLLLKYLK
ncbi:putative membrane protein (TIGR02226 family) [Winogradskyella epiphytica]|uniref:Putative membrane protein (TIGR02226 family) n=1 Tax=Winogradskyella epiphytica TaxID=262005 RepID=A0A2V4Y076_9FLAO|nr:BatA domain-containing protein [Winogradskyella epiphytica]PYE81808.1 putative membrane protein (TIGR02226 family) [Winogradskyella epiphytica]GGW62468.1 membrane protein [Winogradskyella epiphytica]